MFGSDSQRQGLFGSDSQRQGLFGSESQRQGVLVPHSLSLCLGSGFTFVLLTRHGFWAFVVPLSFVAGNALAALPHTVSALTHVTYLSLAGDTARRAWGVWALLRE